MKTFDVKLWDGEIPFFKEDADTPNKMTFYPTETWYPVPCVIVLAGGGFVHRADHEGEPVAEYFVSRGMHAAVVDYRVKPNSYPAPLADVQRAVKLCRANAKQWKIDPEKIVVLGFSAGGYLAAAAATLEDVGTVCNDAVSAESSKPNGAVLCYPCIDLGGKLVSDRVRENFLGADYKGDTAKWSLQNRVTESAPPMFIFHTSDDVVNVCHSLLFAERLRDVGAKFEMHIFNSGKHGMGLGLGYEDSGKWPDMCADWIINNV